MNLSTPTLVADNVVEVLEKVAEFTKRRHDVLTDNILNVATEGFTPMDLNVDGFADVMAQALAEFLQNKRLLLRDIENITFGSNGSFRTPPTVDHEAAELFHSDLKRYLQYEIRKYSENLLNKKVAEELLKQRQEAQESLEV